jgi:TPR repeat protein
MKAEELGESGATTQLGVMAYYGHGQTPDYTAARRYFEKAAEAGDSAAENNLGILYRHGQGVEQDYAKAHEYFFRAAIQEHGGAMANLASLYIEGHGVNVDLVEARRWLEQGVETDDPDAKRNLEQLPMDELFAEGKYGEALDAQKALLESARKAEVEAEGKEGQRTSTEMARVAQFTVFTKDYPGAIAAAEAALKQFPDELMARAQEAHALLLSERLDEARGIYLENRGKTVASRGHLGWERVIAEDFHKLRRAGLGHPKMIEIEDALGLPTR